MQGDGYPSAAWYERALNDTVYALFRFNESDSEILAELSNIGGGAGNILPAVRKMFGYDGYIVKDKYDNAQVFVSFESNQFKSLNNISPSKSNDIRYSLKQGVEIDTDKALNDKTYREDVILTESSPSIIASQKGVRNLPMLMKASHIRENIFTEQEASNMGLKVDEHTHYHGLGKELFLKIIDGLDDVSLAYRGTKNASDSSRRENYFLLISQYKDASGNTVNVPVYIDEWGQYNRVMIETNKIATAFGRDDFNEYIRREIEKGNLVRIKNRSTQDSERGAVIAHGFVENASADSIHQNSKKVNTNSEKINFNLKEDENVLKYELSKGEVKKLVADYTNKKVFSKTESEDIINHILESQLAFDDAQGKIRGKSKVVDMLWQGLNSADDGKRGGKALDIAKYIIQHSTIESMYEDEYLDESMNIVGILKPYLHKINLDSLKGEINNNFKIS